MDAKIKCGTKVLNAHIADSENSDVCVLFLSGGGVKLGKERYFEWQKQLKSECVSSVSFDYSGVNGSGDPLKRSSLKSWIEEAACVMEWMRNSIRTDKYVLYGVSMGGYVALGLVAKNPGVFSKLILHAPAAYSSKAHEITFGEKFTEEIRKKKSWNDSASFGWLKNYDRPVLFIEAESDEVIPDQIIKHYKAVKKENKYFDMLILNGAIHDVWNDTLENSRFRKEIFDKLKQFIK